MAENTSGQQTPPKRPPAPNLNYQPETPPLSVKHHLEHLKALPASKVRWFFQEDKKWIPFNGADSLKIEDVFRCLPHELQSPLCIPSNVDPESISFPTVKGSLYEIDILGRECRPIYWKENAVPIMRGTWFKGAMSGNWEPLSEKESHLIEEAHIQVVRSLGLGSPLVSQTASPAHSNSIHSIKIGVNRVEWHDISEIYIISESTGSRLAQKIGLSGASEIHRGYELECELDDDLAPIEHIIFLVHGMGQLYHGEGGIINSRKKFSSSAEKAERRYFKEYTSEGRIEFFPIEWRTKLKLDEGIIGKITPSNLGSLRKVINDTTLDVFYYTSPFYREEIIQALRREMNAVYLKFIERNPSFEERNGKVSIIAHSLGSVIIHDVLTLWNSYLMKEKKKIADTNVASHSHERAVSWLWGWGREKQKAPSSISLCSEDELHAQLHELRMKMAKIEMKTGGPPLQAAGDVCRKQNNDCYSLEFKVENVFNIGSPLGVFLVMRGIRPRDDIEQHIMPTSVCKRTFNIYDPTDPVAYRLEPLIYDYYSEVPPVRVSQVGCKDNETPSTTKSTGSWLRGFFASKTSTSKADVIEYKKDESEVVELPKHDVEKTEEVLKDKKVLDNRLDYVLEQSMVEYFSAITSHQAYWHSLDLAKFVLYHVYGMENQSSTSNSLPTIVSSTDLD